jgi:hypothetical protein
MDHVADPRVYTVHATPFIIVVTITKPVSGTYETDLRRPVFHTRLDLVEILI